MMRMVFMEDQEKPNSDCLEAGNEGDSIPDGHGPFFRVRNAL
jgi:hypothetical protein